MQDSPQQPANQPFYAPAEMFGQEQVQMYAPARDIIQPLMLAQEIAVYPNRAQAIWRFIVIVVGLIIEIGLFVLLMFLFAFLNGSIVPDDTSASFFSPAFFILLILMLVVVAFFGRIAWRMASTLIFSHKPLLVINREGITVGPMQSLSGFFIPWAEVEAISSRTFMYKYLCIQPRNQKEFMKRFNWWERFIRLSNSIFGIPPLIVPQVFLERPVEEILSTLYYTYANELAYYHVQLRP
jgi:hypothetical protein